MHPRLLAALAAQRQHELLRAAGRARRRRSRHHGGEHLALRLRVRRALGWVLVEVGLKLAVDASTHPDPRAASESRRAA